MKREPITDVVHKTMEALPNKVDKDVFQKQIVGDLGRVQKVGDFPMGAVVPRPDSINHENTDASPRMNHRAFQ